MSSSNPDISVSQICTAYKNSSTSLFYQLACYGYEALDNNLLQYYLTIITVGVFLHCLYFIGRKKEAGMTFDYFITLHIIAANILGLLIHVIATLMAIAGGTERLWCILQGYLFTISSHSRRSIGWAIAVDHLNSVVLPPRYGKYRKAAVIATLLLVCLFATGVSLFSLPDMLESYQERYASYGTCYTAFTCYPTCLSYKSIIFSFLDAPLYVFPLLFFVLDKLMEIKCAFNWRKENDKEEINLLFKVLYITYFVFTAPKALITFMSLAHPAFTVIPEFLAYSITALHFSNLIYTVEGFIILYCR